jgi:hypothetical protein
MENFMEQAVLFCRISDIKQNDGYSLEAQEKHGKEYCKANRFSIIETYSFTETASKNSKRNKFSKVIDFLTKKALKSLIDFQEILPVKNRYNSWSSQENLRFITIKTKGFLIKTVALLRFLLMTFKQQYLNITR